VEINWAQSQITDNGENPAIPADSLGYLVVKTQLDSTYVIIDGDFQKVNHVSSTDTISIKLGDHKVRIAQRYHRDVVTNISIRPDTLYTINTNILPIYDDNDNYKYYSSYPRIYWEVPVIVLTDPEARLYVDGEYIGTQMGRINMTGQFTVKSELPNGEIKTKTFDIDENEQTFLVEDIYHRSDKKKSRYLSVLPGVSQLYQNDTIKGYSLLGAVTLSAGFAIKYHADFISRNRTYLETERQYRFTSNAGEALRLGDLAEEQLNMANRMAERRDIFIWITSAVYVYSLVDAWIKPKNGYRSKIGLDPYIDFTDTSGYSKGISLTYNF
jgi:hypothetical protein